MKAFLGVFCMEQMGEKEFIIILLSGEKLKFN